jgi:hypothetical protein
VRKSIRHLPQRSCVDHSVIRSPPDKADSSKEDSEHYATLHDSSGGAGGSLEGRGRVAGGCGRVAGGSLEGRWRVAGRGQKAAGRWQEGSGGQRDIAGLEVFSGLIVHTEMFKSV